MKTFDVVVAGLGAMGSAIAYQCAKRKLKVLGIDRFSPPHAFGSSHGETRITRLAIGEGVHYTPFVLRSHALWREIEADTGSNLLTITGGLVISSPARTSNLHVSTFFANTVQAARQHGIAHELLDAEEIRRRFPPFKLRDDERGYYEPGAGFLRPEACIGAELALASRYGAQVHADELMLAFEADDGAVIVRTNRDSYAAGTLILSIGAWLPNILGLRFRQIFRVFRQVLFWFGIDGAAESFLPSRLPVFIWELMGPSQAIYGFPAVNGPQGGVKVATQQYEETTTPETVQRSVSPAEAAAMHRTYVAPYIAGLGSTCLKAISCLYTVTPDAGFVIDSHPDFARVLLVSPCSGHGFKHSAAIGEAVAEVLCNGKSRLDLAPFRLQRFSSATT